MNKFQDLIESFIREKQESKGHAFNVADWLDSASKRASQISIATHVLKFLHSDAKGTNVNAKIGKLISNHESLYVTTASLYRIKEDIVGNAAVMDVGSFLQIEVDGVTLLDLIVKGDASPFHKFAESELRLSTWMNGFKSVLIDKQLSSDALAKQVYFPVKENTYHLLAPLYASSLSQALYDKVKENRYGEIAKTVRNCKKEKLYSGGVVIDYPNLACQMFGGTKPQNISRLNSLRGGRAYLLRSVPPIWATLKRPPMKKKAFWQGFDRRAYPVLKDFQCFLIAIKDLTSNLDRRDVRQEYVDRLLDLLLQAAVEIQSMKSGWSLASEIPMYEKIWLDPLREDLVDVNKLGDWMDEVSSYFAKWVLDKLKYKNNNMNFPDVDYDYLKDECLMFLKEFS